MEKRFHNFTYRIPRNPTITNARSASISRRNVLAVLSPSSPGLWVAAYTPWLTTEIGTSHNAGEDYLMNDASTELSSPLNGALAAMLLRGPAVAASCLHLLASLPGVLSVDPGFLSPSAIPRVRQRTPQRLAQCGAASAVFVGASVPFVPNVLSNQGSAPAWSPGTFQHLRAAACRNLSLAFA